MNMERRVCAWKECDIEFAPVTSNQIYHDEECQRLATNARIMERYYERKARRKGARRVCAYDGCSTILSRYNDSRTCGMHDRVEEETENKNFLESLIGN